MKNNKLLLFGTLLLITIFSINSNNLYNLQNVISGAAVFVFYPAAFMLGPVYNSVQKSRKSIYNNDKNNKRNISIIFEDEPKMWELSGDPWFWRHLKKLFEKCDILMNDEDLEILIKIEHKRLTGENLTNSSSPDCKDFDCGGISRGLISGNYWINHGIPLLQDRLKNLK